jgi:hypothetical protein
MTTYTNKTFNNSTYTRKSGSGLSWFVGQVGITIGQAGLTMGYLVGLPTYLNKEISLAGVSFFIWTELTDTWDDYTQSWANLKTEGLATQYTNKTRSS